MRCRQLRPDSRTDHRGRRAPGVTGTFRICELGDQTIQVSRRRRKPCMPSRSRTRRRGGGRPAGPASPARRASRPPMHVRDVFLAAGCDYVSIDVNEEGGAAVRRLELLAQRGRVAGNSSMWSRTSAPRSTSPIRPARSPRSTISCHPGAWRFTMCHRAFPQPRAGQPDAALPAQLWRPSTTTPCSRASSPTASIEAITFHYGTDILFMRGTRKMLRIRRWRPWRSSSCARIPVCRISRQSTLAPITWSGSAAC